MLLVEDRLSKLLRLELDWLRELFKVLLEKDTEPLDPPSDALTGG